MGANVPGKKREFLLYLGGIWAVFLPGTRPARRHWRAGRGLMSGVCKETGLVEMGHKVSLRIFRVAYLGTSPTHG